MLSNDFSYKLNYIFRQEKSMLDNNTFKSIEDEISAILVQYSSIFYGNEIAIVVDNKLNILWYSQSSVSFFAEIASMSKEELLYKNIEDIAINPVRKEWIMTSIMTTIKEKKRRRFLSIRFDRPSGKETIMSLYKPIIDDGQHVYGVVITLEPVLFPIYFNYEKILYLVKIGNREGAHKINNSTNRYNMSAREHEIMFLLFFCDTYEEIASVLSLIDNKVISFHAVAKIITRNLYPRFNVYNIKALKEVALKKRFHKQIPHTLFGEFICRITDL